VLRDCGARKLFFAPTGLRLILQPSLERFVDRIPDPFSKQGLAQGLQFETGHVELSWVAGDAVNTRAMGQTSTHWI